MQKRRLKFTIVGPTKGSQISDLKRFLKKQPRIKGKIIKAHAMTADVSGDVIFLWVKHMPHKHRQMIEKRHGREKLRWIAGGYASIKTAILEEMRKTAE